MKKGNIVKFKTPLADENPDERYIVREDSDNDNPRVLVSPLSLLHWNSLTPTSRYNKDEMEIISNSLEKFLKTQE